MTSVTKGSEISQIGAQIDCCVCHISGSVCAWAHTYISVKLSHRYTNILSQYNPVLLPKQALLSTLLPLPIFALCYLLHYTGTRSSTATCWTQQRKWSGKKLTWSEKKKRFHPESVAKLLLFQHWCQLMLLWSRHEALTRPRSLNLP